MKKQLFLKALDKFFGNNKFCYYWHDNIKVELKFRDKVEKLAKLYDVKLSNCCVCNNVLLANPETMIFSCDLIF